MQYHWILKGALLHSMVWVSLCKTNVEKNIRTATETCDFDIPQMFLRMFSQRRRKKKTQTATLVKTSDFSWRQTAVVHRFVGLFLLLSTTHSWSESAVVLTLTTGSSGRWTTEGKKNRSGQKMIQEELFERIIWLWPIGKELEDHGTTCCL